MSEPDERAASDIEGLARAILDGEPLDWTSPAASTDRDLLDELRVLAAIADVHRPGAHDGVPEGLGRWGHLTLLEKIGHGTSGDVFLAIDNRLQRAVALKVLRRAESDHGAPIAAVDEACLLARVRHPNVLTIFGAEIEHGRVGIITEHVDGRTLAEVLREQGALGSEEATSIGLSLCRALSAVHAAGLIHRDVKAQNVMREKGGRIVLMDLGSGMIAAGSAPTVSGTPLYVAPEVMAGAEATAQSDLWSLGVLLFHLVTGDYPVSGRTVAAIASAHQAGRRTLISNLRPSLPPAFTAIVDRALSANPAQRFQSAGEMEAALLATISVPAPRTGHARLRRGAAWAAAAVLVLAAGAGGARLWRERVPAAAAVPFESRDWALVIPFENRTGNASLDGALEHAFTHALSTSAYVNVVPPERVEDVLRLMTLPPSTPLDARRAREVAARDGNVRVILAGSIAQVGGTYPITVNVVDPTTGGVLASAREEPRDESAIPDAMRKLSSWVRLTLGEASRQVIQDTKSLEKVTTPSLAALQAYSEAMKATRNRSWGLAESWLKAATAEDPEFASAHIWLAWAQHNLGLGNADSVLADQSLRTAQRAVALVGNTTPRERHFILGSNFYLRDRNAEAAAEFEALLTLYPDDYWGQHKLYEVARQTMPPEKILELTLRGVAARPNDPNSQLRAATEVIRTALPEARPYFARAVELGRASDALRGTDLRYASLFQAHDLWTQRRIGDAARVLEEVEQQDFGPDGGDWALHPSVTFRLTFGQPRAADRFARRMQGPDMRTMAQASTALAREDMASLPNLLAGYRLYDVVAVSLLIRAGRVGDAERLLARLVTPAQPFADSAAEIAVARGDLGEPRRQLQEAIVRMRFSGARSYLYTETLAEALARNGDTPGAIRTLEAQVAGGHAAYSRAGHPGHLWMRCARTLADLYRADGRLDDARRIEADLLAALSHAEPDFPLLLELRRRAGQ